MALYRTISLTFWTDSKISDEFTPEDRYFYLYLFTNPHTNLAGCYEISTRQMAHETGYNVDSVERLLKRFSEVHKVAYYSQSTKELLLLNWHKYNWTTSAQFRKPLEKEIENIKHPDFRQYLQDIFDGKENIRYGIDTKCIGTNCSDTSVTVTVNNNIPLTKGITNKELKDNLDSSNRFIPPTVEEVEAYCQERDNEVDAEQFVDFYESKGWMVGKNKMKNWKASVRTWERDTSKGKAKREQEKQDREDKAKGIEHIDDWSKVDKYGNYKP